MSALFDELRAAHAVALAGVRDRIESAHREADSRSRELRSAAPSAAGGPRAARPDREPTGRGDLADYPVASWLE
ncbi:hypothetical protein [Rhodococcus sp. NPDC127528]|uniref:hypothetical protein n=1 Tax=unclassified Rhodococcus (in: high G+C Gram-positive bacteria) TaxID=192944 RepID=UPI00362BE4D3